MLSGPQQLSMEPAGADDPLGSGGRRETSPVLREVMTSLRPFLAQLGLVPSRVVTFMMGSDHEGPQFTSREMMRSILRHERSDETGRMASLFFVEMLLSDEAPPTALSVFMEALFTANHDPQYLNPNPGAWRVHDIIQLACVYMPLQQALHDFRQEDGQHIDVQGVVTHLSERRLLAPEMSPHVLDTLEVDGPEQALVFLLAAMYATRVDSLKHDFEEWAQGMSSGGDAPATGHSAFWLRSVMEAIQAHGGDGFGRLVPESVFSADTWNEVYDQLAYGRRGRIQDDEDTQSEGGESVATIIPDKEDNGRPLVERPKLPAWEERQQNLDDRSSRQRRALNGTDQGHEIKFIMQFISYEFQSRALHPPVPDPSAATSDDLDESASVLTQSSENNSQVPGVGDDASTRISSNNNVPLRLMHDLTRPLRVSSDGMVELRAYQEELLYWARQGCNVAIFLPTGTGKTFIILRYMQECLRRPGLNRVVFLAPKVKLAEQQYHRFNEFFPHATYFRCGKYTSSSAPFSELLDTFKVFVMTPQCLVDAIQRKEVKMTDFSMLILDECHHVARGKHAFRVLMDVYMDVKYSPESQPNNDTLPQVIGLTASPGVGPQGNLDSAVKHIQQLCYIMNVERICTVREERNKEELQFYINEPKHRNYCL